MVVYAGSLVPEELLSWARPGTPAISSASLPLEEIVSTMVQAQRAGKRVVRLHTGDPSLYGAIFEQIAELDKLGIPFRIIPGVSAAFAAAAALGIEYTLPEISQTLILTRAAGRTPVPEREPWRASPPIGPRWRSTSAWARSKRWRPPLRRTMARLPPAPWFTRRASPVEKVIRTRLNELVEKVRAAGITRQALVIVGRVLEVGPQDLKAKSKLYDKDFEHGFRK